MSAATETRAFEYLLNAMERAAQSDEPAKAGYSGARQTVLAYVAALEAENAKLRKAVELMRNMVTSVAAVVDEVSGR